MARKKGDGSWGKCVIKGVAYDRFKKQYDGEASRKCFYGKSVAEVKQKVKEYEDKRNSQTLITSPKITFGEYIVQWLEKNKLGNIKQRTYESYESLLNDYIIHFKKFDLANKQMGQLTSEMFQTHINFLAETLARSTIVKLYIVITQCLKYAYKQKHINADFWEDYHIPTEENMTKKKKTPICLNKEDMLKLFSEAKRLNAGTGRRAGKLGEYAYGGNAFVVMMLISTGMRIGEALALTWDDIDFDKNIISVNKSIAYVKNEKYTKGSTTENIKKPIVTTPKTRASNRYIPMSDITIWAVNALKAEQNKRETFSHSGSVCLNKNGNLIAIRNLRVTLNAMLKAGKCSVETCGLHALRHSFGSILLRDNVDIAVISRLLGHTDVSTTYNVYIHIAEEQKTQAMSAFHFITT